MELIDRQALKDYVNSLSTHPLNEWDTWGVLSAINKQPTIDAVPVVRCKDCVYYHKAHVKLDDGTELDYDSDVVKEYQQKRKESGDPFWEMVCADLGMNVGGRCERDNNQGYAEDKAVFRSETDFCSKAREKREVQDGKD